LPGAVEPGCRGTTRRLHGREFMKGTARLLAGAGALLCASQGVAQSEQSIEEIIVTGSFIERSSFDSSSPLDLVTQELEVFIDTTDNPELDDQGFSPFGEVVEGMEVVDRFHAGYGDGPPRGEDGVYQAMAIAKGAEYLADFPELDRIVDATVAEPRDPSSDDGP